MPNTLTNVVEFPKDWWKDMRSLSRELCLEFYDDQILEMLQIFWCTFFLNWYTIFTPRIKTIFFVLNHILLTEFWKKILLVCRSSETNRMLQTSRWYFGLYILTSFGRQKLFPETMIYVDFFFLIFRFSDTCELVTITGLSIFL